MRCRALVVPLALLLSTGWACSSSSAKTPTTPAESVPAADPSVAPTSGPLPDEISAADAAGAEPEMAEEAAQRSDLRADDPTLITIGEPTVAARPTTLAEASAKALEERRKRAGSRPVAGPVITNDNLSEFAAEGQVTFSPGTSDPGLAAKLASGQVESREEFWRGRVLGIRTAWAEAHDQIEILEEEASSLRWRFYAEDDGYFRDERIKPEWDRALDELRRTREEARAQEELLEKVLDEGRRAGALPGWLREGVELEPEPAEETDSQPRRQDPIPPPIYDPDGSNF